MLKVDKLEVVVNVSEVMNVYGGGDIDFMNDFYKGGGIYEMKIGSRGEVESIELNDEYVTLQELKDDNVEYEEEWYDVSYKDEGYGIGILEVGYYEESYSVFFKVKE
jgi:hypothetical protein